MRIHRSVTAHRSGLEGVQPHYHHGNGNPASASRRGNHKLIEFFEDGSAVLYDLAAWREEVGARMPRPNPDHDPARASELVKRNRRQP